MPKVLRGYSEKAERNCGIPSLQSGKCREWAVTGDTRLGSYQQRDLQRDCQPLSGNRHKRGASDFNEFTREMSKKINLDIKVN